MSNTKKKRRIPIIVKLFIMLIVSLALAFGVFYAVYQAGNFLVWRNYLNEMNKQERAEKYVEDFQKYVTRNKLTVSDSDLIQKWSGGDYVDILVYMDSNLVYAPEWFEQFKQDEEIKGDEPFLPDDGQDTNNESSFETSESEEESLDETQETSGSESEIESEDKGYVEDESQAESESLSETETESETEEVDAKTFYENLFSGDRGFEQYLTEEGLKAYRTALDDALSGNEKLHPVYFVDGTMLVAVVDYSEELMSNLVFAVALVSGLVVVAVVMIAYFSTIARRIRRLSKNVSIVERGNLEHKIDEKGNDEISRLAKDVESMRDAIIENMTKERRAWEANAGLITAMSHDIRTPLTVLSGYLDLIELQNDDSINAEYIDACKDNIMRLKNLSDDMFSYFLVFGKGGAELELCTVSSGKWLDHIIAEYAILLSEKGYNLEYGTVPDVTVRIDEKYFRRVVDNVFSNIMKYADPSKPVMFDANEIDSGLALICQNEKKQHEEIPESNGIGIKTCIKIMEEMGGSFEIEETDSSYTVRIIIPREAD